MPKMTKSQGPAVARFLKEV